MIVLLDRLIGPLTVCVRSLALLEEPIRIRILNHEEISSPNPIRNGAGSILQ